LLYEANPKQQFLEKLHWIYKKNRQKDGFSKPFPKKPDFEDGLNIDIIYSGNRAGVSSRLFFAHFSPEFFSGFYREK